MELDRLEICVVMLSLAAISFVVSVRMGGLIAPEALSNAAKRMKNFARQVFL